MMTEPKRSSTDPGGIEAPRNPGAPVPAPVHSPTVDDHGRVVPRSFDTLVPAPEADAQATDLLGGRQVDTGESLQRLEEKRVEEERQKRIKTIWLIVGFGVIAIASIFVVSAMLPSSTVVPAATTTPTATTAVPTATATATATTTASATAITVDTTLAPPTSAAAVASVHAIPTVKATATTTASAATAVPTSTASTTPSAKPSASHDPDYIRDFHP